MRFHIGPMIPFRVPISPMLNSLGLESIKNDAFRASRNLAVIRQFQHRIVYHDLSDNCPYHAAKSMFLLALGL